VSTSKNKKKAYDEKTEQINYQCTHCGAKGCKLWRDYNTFLCALDLYCVNCAGANQKKDVSEVRADGKRPFQVVEGGHVHYTDQVGWLVPAATTADGTTFWGYSSVPEDRVQWWKDLPTYPPAGKETK